jgi:hypothetical protein
MDQADLAAAAALQTRTKRENIEITAIETITLTYFKSHYIYFITIY